MYRVKKKIVWLLAVLMVAVSIPGSVFAQYDLSKNTYIDVKKTPSGKTGENITINMVFTNNTGSDLDDVAVRFDRDIPEQEYQATEDADEDTKYTGSVFPFEISSNTFNNKKLGKVKSGSSKTFSLTARVRRDVSEGYYLVPLEVVTNAKKKDDGAHASYEKVNIWITKSSATTTSGANEGTISFELGEDQNTPFGTYPEVMNFNMNVRNSSSVTAFDVNIRMGVNQDSTKFPFDINDGNYTRHYDRVGGGETISVPYSMMIRKDAYSGYYPITYTIEYRDSTDGDIQKAERTFYVKVQNKEKEEDTKEFNANDRTKARIVVDGFETNPEKVYAGEEFELTLHMKNASESVTASNILFNLESEKVTDSAVFTTDEGSSSIVVNTLAAGQIADIKVKLRAGAWVDQRTYGLTINEKYDSPEFKNAEEKITVNIPVKQVARLNTGTIDVMPDSITTGSETNIMFPINNTGKVLLYNVMVSFAGDSIQPANTYVGNIKPGETGNVDAMITGAAPTADDGKIKVLITYEDENGVVSDPIEKEITLMVTEPEETVADMGDMAELPADVQPTGFAKYSKVLIPAAALFLVVLAGAAFFFWKRRKKKMLAAEEELNDEI
ncbi:MULTISPECIES: hypothetical protein [Lacrimispora]|uniref:COG1361 S-layer family protein n=1 Tax=Lacrimispora TaxID=2719231 RepID=UPI000BE3BE30|nr:hypothetical protein [Lacrimispora amygdalina]MDK2964433.1 hypothetical protein [Lacrimispora sp.]